jgi:hypothetical protein
VNRSKLVLISLGVTALLVLAGIASNGRPLRGGRGNGASTVFFDYVYTTLALLGIAVFLTFLYAVMTMRLERTQARPDHWRLWSMLLGMALAVGVGALLLRTGVIDRIRQQAQRVGAQQGHSADPQKQQRGAGRNAEIRWDEVALIVVTIAGIVVVLAATRPKRPTKPRRERQEAISLALDESLEDLRDEPDLRRAIIAAYARMERALAAAGLPRRPSEAPFEYIGRALRELDTSADAAEQLTALFEWAKFSQHEPEPSMRDEAIEALVAVRDELLGPVDVAA